jgi:flagellar hook-basal body complex protein FliE
MVEELRGLVANAKTDVSISSTVLQRIEQASTKLSQAQLQTEQFLNGVAVVLGKAHEEFRTSVTTSLSKSNHEFQQKLASAVGMLSASIKELDDVLGTATPRGRRA